MARRPRVHLPNGFYHATLRGNHRQALFQVDGDRRLLNAIVGRALDQYGASLHAYCWMTNHLHFLIQISDTPLGAVMRQIASGYARAYQQKLETTGHLFERRYHARLVGVDPYLLQLVRYIHLNPVQAGLVRHAGLYPWSSHLAYAGGRGEPWLDTDFVLPLFGRDRPRAQAAYREFMAQGDSDWTPPDEPTPFETSLQPATTMPFPKFAPARKGVQSLEPLLMEACERFGLEVVDLTSDKRENRIIRARAWVGYEATRRGVANLSEVARALGRDRATLRYAIRRLKAGHPGG